MIGEDARFNLSYDSLRGKPARDILRSLRDTNLPLYLSLTGRKEVLDEARAAQDTSEEEGSYVEAEDELGQGDSSTGLTTVVSEVLRSTRPASAAVPVPLLALAYAELDVEIAQGEADEPEETAANESVAAQTAVMPVMEAPPRRSGRKSRPSGRWTNYEWHKDDDDGHMTEMRMKSKAMRL